MVGTILRCRTTTSKIGMYASPTVSATYVDRNAHRAKQGIS